MVRERMRKEKEQLKRKCVKRKKERKRERGVLVLVGPAGRSCSVEKMPPIPSFELKSRITPSARGMHKVIHKSSFSLFFAIIKESSVISLYHEQGDACVLCGRIIMYLLIIIHHNGHPPTRYTIIHTHHMYKTILYWTHSLVFHKMGVSSSLLHNGYPIQSLYPCYGLSFILTAA